MKKTDRQLGMDRDITRRDFLHDGGMAALGIGALGAGIAPAAAESINYPPTRTGLRGSHPGSFESAHALARDGVQFGPANDTGEEYDLVVVGGGISGLAAARYYLGANPDARILVLENHDDFGGHARRNEFHQGGVMRLAWGGVFNLEVTLFSDLVREFLDELGIDTGEMRQYMEFDYGTQGRNGAAIWFDEEHYGEDRLVAGVRLEQGSLSGLARTAGDFPLDAASRDSLKRFAEARLDVTAGMDAAAIAKLMHGTSYREFLVKHGGLTETAAKLFDRTTDGYWGVSAHSMSVAECMQPGLPALHLLGQTEEPGGDYRVAMFPDGNASVARMLVRSLVPDVAPGHTMNDIVSARFDYSKLDRPSSRVRIRLESTVVNVEEIEGAVHASYVRGGKVQKVRAKQAVLACWNCIIPHLCPQLSRAQKEALKYPVKRPLILTNVLLRNSKAHEKLGINGAYCPGRYHSRTWLCRGIHAADYRHERDDDGPVSMMFWGMPPTADPSMHLFDQMRAGQASLMSMSFEDFEREIRTVCDRMLGPGGFDVKRDILAITVNRWPHGYAHDYMDLWDPEWPEGQAPHEIARRRFGNIAIANTDAGADAYTHVAIEQAFRAVNELLA